MLRRLLPRAAGVALVCVLSAAPAAHAQDVPVQVQRPADIRLGSCAALGDVVVPLSSILLPPGDPQGQSGATPVEQSVTEVPLPLSELLASGHAIAVHPSPEQVGTPVACGEIGGALASDGTLAVGLNAMNGAKLSGVAYFAPVADGSATAVTLLVIDERAGRRGDGGTGSDAGAVAEEPTSGDAAAVDDASTVDDASGADSATAPPAAAPAPAPAPAPATAGLDGASTISADNADGKNAKPDRNKDKATADRDGNGNAGTATTDSADKERGGERGEREREGRAGEDGGANG